MKRIWAVFAQSGVSDKEITRLQQWGHSTLRRVAQSHDYLWLEAFSSLYRSVNLSLRAGQFLCSTFSIYSRFGDCACERLSVGSETLSTTRASRRRCQGGGLERENWKQLSVALSPVCPLSLLMNLSPSEPGPAAGFFLFKGNSSSPLLLVCGLWASGQRQSWLQQTSYK